MRFNELYLQVRVPVCRHGRLPYPGEWVGWCEHGAWAVSGDQPLHDTSVPVEMLAVEQDSYNNRVLICRSAVCSWAEMPPPGTTIYKDGLVVGRVVSPEQAILESPLGNTPRDTKKHR